MPLKIKASADDRGLRRKALKLDGLIKGAVKQAASDLRESVGVRTGRLKRSIKGRAETKNRGYVSVNFYGFAHLAQRTGQKKALQKIVYEGALKGARNAVK